MAQTSPSSDASAGIEKPLFDDVGQWLQSLSHPRILVELAALALCVLLAWLCVFLVRRAVGYHYEEDSENNNPLAGRHHTVFLGRRVLDGVLFPLTLLGLAYVARAVLLQWWPVTTFKVALPILMALVLVRTGAQVLRAAFVQAPWVLAIERTISWLAWGTMVLWVTGLLPLLLRDLEDITWKVGGSSMSVRTLIEGLITAAAVLIAALWVSSALEERLLRQATGGSLSVRKAFSNALRALLLFVGLITALSAVGIDLTTLSVLGGAVGVGIGMGLQKLTASYVSGFIILTERSVRIGDSVRVDNFEGRVTDITGRYTVIRTVSGRESIVPNEMLINNRVENLSLADPRVWNSTVVSVGYDSDVEVVMRLLSEAALSQTRVLRDPPPSVALSAFGVDGLEFTVGFWIDDPQNGLLGLRSDINLAILRALREHGIDIPYPQRVVHHKHDANHPPHPHLKG